MEWRLDDDRPIWQQLTQQLTRRIITGGYPPGSRLPPVRELAAQDLDAAMLMGLEMSIESLEKRGVAVNSYSVQARDYLKGKQST